MKINYRNTCLHWLTHPEKMDFYIPENNKWLTEQEEKKFGKSLITAFTNLIRTDVQPRPFQNIRYLSKPFLDAYEKGKTKLVNIFDKEEIEETGTFLTQDGSFTNTYFYYLKTFPNEKQWRFDMTLIIFTKHTKADLPGLDCSIVVSDKNEKTFLYKKWEDTGNNAIYWMSWLITLLCFIKYCPLETKVVNAGKKEHHVGQKYVNETTHNIEVLDSNWFTTIVRSEGFKVGGHFRMQPYGIGLSQRRLQWIEPFEKHGYTKKARILSNNQL